LTTSDMLISIPSTASKLNSAAFQTLYLCN
jgi:hypothetical protein